MNLYHVLNLEPNYLTQYQSIECRGSEDGPKKSLPKLRPLLSVSHAMKDKMSETKKGVNTSSTLTTERRVA